jgi:hypothetical protein
VMFGCLDVWTFGRLDVWMFGCLDVWMFGCLDNICLSLDFRNIYIYMREAHGEMREAPYAN